MSNSGARVVQLDGWRGVSILCVLGAHLLPLGPSGWELNYALGLAGMSLFFALSGFLITQFLMHRPDPGAFLVRRFLRILPLAWLVLLILVPFSQNQDLLVVVQRFAFLQNYAHDAVAAPSSHYWSLCVELHFYIGVALLVLFGKQRGLYLLPLIGFGITLARVATGTYATIETHLRLDEILSGATLALLVSTPKYKRMAALVGRAPLLPLALLWLASCHPKGFALNYLRPYLAAALIGRSMLGPTPLLEPILTSRTLRYFAEVSYAVYVLHGPLRTGWFSTGSTLERYLLKRPITLMLTFGLAHLSTFYFENRFIALGRKLTTPRAPQQRATSP